MSEMSLSFQGRSPFPRLRSGGRTASREVVPEDSSEMLPVLWISSSVLRPTP